MKRRFLVISIALLAVVFMFVAGHFILTVNPPVRQIDNAAEVYNNAVLPISSADDLVFSVSKTRKTTVEGNVFTEHTQQTVNCIGLSSANPQISTKETSSIGTHGVSISEHYNDGTAYVQVGDGLFSCAMRFEDYVVRLSPAVVLNANLYESITGTYDGSSYTINFKHPTAPEQWMPKAESGFLDAWGTAHISHDGKLTQSIYNIKYTQGDALIDLTVIVEPIANAPEIDQPEDISLYKPITYFDGPRTLERATGYLLQAENVSAYYSDRIYFQAFGEERTQQITLHCSSSDSYSALMDTRISLSNEIHSDQSFSNTKTELFTDDQYRISENGSNFTANGDITADDMSTYCQNLLVTTVMLPQYIADAEILETESTLRISFSATEDFAQVISSNACQTMYQKPELLTELAQSNTTQALDCYLEIDKNTGFPVASGIDYTGTYSVEDISYQLCFRAEQTYDILSLIANNEIQKAAGA